MLAAHDGAVRAELAASGALFDGYHPRMEAVHRENAARLLAITGGPRVARPSSEQTGPKRPG